MTYEMSEKEQAIFDKLPPLEEDSQFALSHVFTHHEPHPYMIGSQHIAIAADKFGGVLSNEIIKYAEERHYARCYHKDCLLSFEEHKGEAVVLLMVPRAVPLGEVKGLHAWLLKAKDTVEGMNVKGFAFKPIH